mmetsp:Transcript_34677/g.68416  ORF Transcript_34677/g.68416 Transcript_34677/m.68416 type:complete len:85 (-) Transcript_34677:584-838(-)
MIELGEGRLSVMYKYAAAQQQHMAKITLPMIMPTSAPTLRPPSEDSALGPVPPAAGLLTTTVRADTPVTLMLIEFSARAVAKLL